MVAIEARYRVRVEVERDGDLAQGREGVARTERATVDEQTNLFGQMYVDRERARAIDLEPFRHGPDCLNY